MTARSDQKSSFRRTDHDGASKAEQAEETRMVTRSLCGALKFWRRCETVRCRREHGCAGDPDACFERGFAALSEDWKEWLRGAVEARMSGASAGEIARAGNARRAAYLQPRIAHLQARIADLEARERLGNVCGQDTPALQSDRDRGRNEARDETSPSGLPSRPRHDSGM